MALTYLDSVMIEIPAAIALLSSQSLTADNLFVKDLEATTLDAGSIQTPFLEAQTIQNPGVLNNGALNSGDILTSTINAAGAQITNAVIADASITNTNTAFLNALVTTTQSFSTTTGSIVDLKSSNTTTDTLSAQTGIITSLSAEEFYVDKFLKNLSNVLYVSMGGDDNNTGTNMFNSLRTIKKACEIAHNARIAANNNPNVRYTIFVNTGDYTENNPIYVPPNASIIGDNLRRVNIRPLNRQEDIFWVDNSTYIWGVTFRSHFHPSAAVAFPDPQTSRLSAIAFRNLTPPVSGWIRPYITTSPYTQGSSSITSGLSSNLQSVESQVFDTINYTNGAAASTVIDSSFNTVTDIMLYGPGSVDLYTGANTTGAVAASALIGLNTEFVKKEVRAFVTQQYPNLAALPNILTTCERDIGYILSAVSIDIVNGTNEASIQSGEAYWDGVTSVLPQDQVAPTIATVQFAQRLVKHIIKNESIPTLEAGMGMRVDGSKVEGFLRSMVLDSYTQFNENGKGIYILNNGYAQLVSIFTICCTEGIICESGGTCSISNSNCSFGLSGIVARGKSPTPVLSGVVIGTVTSPEDTQTTKIVVMSGVQGLPIYPDSPYYPTFQNNPAIGLDSRRITFEPFDNLVFTVNTGTEEPLYTIIGNPVKSIIDGNLVYTVEIIERTPVSTFVPGNSAAFFLRSTAYASSHTFEFIGSGVILRDSVPSLGGQSNIENEAVFEKGGAVFYTSTNHTGDFYIGKEFRVVQSTGTIEGDTFKRSILTLVSPLNLALGE